MMLSPSKQLELDTLMEAVCEDRLSPEESLRLEKWLGECHVARRRYREYVTLHGILYWDTAIGLDSTELPVFRHEDRPTPAATTESVAPAALSRRRLAKWGVSAVVLAALSLLVVLFNARGTGPDDPGHTSGGGLASQDSRLESAEGTVAIHSEHQRTRGPVDIHQPIRKNDSTSSSDSVVGLPPDENRPELLTEGSSDETIQAFVARELSERWAEHRVVPSPRADDLEWMRRVYLDLVGHIPPAYEAEQFLSDTSPRKREQLVDDLLDRSEFVLNWSSLWANLMVGRAPERAEYREQLLKFLRDGFRENRPWNEVVAAIVSAEGTLEENGASGFLLAHVNNQAVPATAITAKLFLGTDVQCTQCHDHPTNGEKQNQFWELNSFFKQTSRITERITDPKTGVVTTQVSLVKRDDAEGQGPAFYETRQGLVRPAYPIYGGVEIDAGPETNRRRELGRLFSAGDKPQIAEAFVNRLWAHFFGYGFTNPVDDMGPHNAPSHPKLLDRLAREFVLSGYDQKRLMKWICLSDAYARTSRMGEGNTLDDPELGESPLFSRVYLKSMSAEQVYHSLLVATGVIHSLKGDWSQVEQQRDEWLEQFVHVYDNDENDEETHFVGTISQALMLMNGDLIQQALASGQPTYFRSVAEAPTSEEEKIRKLCLAALTREPTERELAAFRRILASRSRGALPGQRKEIVVQGMQDVFWAYLNSSEFVSVH